MALYKRIKKEMLARTWATQNVLPSIRASTVGALRPYRSG